MSEEIKDQELERDEQTAAEEQTDCQTNEQAQPQEEELTESPAEELSPEAKLQAELDKLKDAHLCLVAEYDNYRKRTLKEKSELIRSGGEKALTDLLPVVDDLDIALQNLDKASDLEALKEGMHLIHAKFVDYLSRQGVKAIETEGAAFDDELHEAIALLPAAAEEQKGKIMDCVKKGYKLHAKVLRHALVAVCQ